jgi:hypothetical protein
MHTDFSCVFGELTYFINTRLQPGVENGVKTSRFNGFSMTGNR